MSAAGPPQGTRPLGGKRREATHRGEHASAATIDLTILVERLRTAGFRVDTRQYLTAHELLLAYAERGISLAADAAALASHLGPIFCTQPDEQRRFAAEVAAWQGEHPEPSLSSAPPQKPFAFWRRWRWRLLVLTVAAALAASAGVLLYQEYRDLPLSGEVLIEQRDGIQRPAIGAHVRFRDQPVVIDSQARFTLLITHADGFGSLQAELEGFGPANASVGTKTPQPIKLVLRRLPPPPTPQHSITLGVARAIALGAPVAEIRAGDPPWKIIVPGTMLAALITMTLLGAPVVARKRLALQRLSSADGAEEVTLTPPPASGLTVSDHVMRRLASAWRRPREQAIVELDAPATVDATLRSGGLFAPVYTARRSTPEYLALVHRRSADDHWAGFVLEWLDSLAATGVVIDVMTFHDDPRMCYARDERRRAQPLSSLAAQHHRAIVLLFADSDACFAPGRDELEAWVATLHALPRRVLFTPEAAYRWGRREWSLAAEGFVILPATGEGFRLFAEMTADWRIESMFPAPYARAYPNALADEPQRWLDRNAPSVDVMEKLVRDLRGYLGPDGFAWLCACAVYPQLSWPLTLYLARNVDDVPHGATTAPVLFESSPALGRLPWLRYGFMPDWLRRTLIARLSPQQDARVRSGIEALLEELVLPATSAGGGTGKPGTPQVRAGGLSISRWVSPTDLLSAAPGTSPLSDRVFLGFMSSSNVDPLPVPVAANFRRLFGREIGTFASAANEDRLRESSPNSGAAAPSASGEAAPLSVFLSYRRADSLDYARRIAQALGSLQNTQVFLDETSIAPGINWYEAIPAAIRSADVVLVVIGPRWLVHEKASA